MMHLTAISLHVVTVLGVCDLDDASGSHQLTCCDPPCESVLQDCVCSACYGLVLQLLSSCVSLCDVQ